MFLYSYSSFFLFSMKYIHLESIENFQETKKIHEQQEIFEKYL